MVWDWSWEGDNAHGQWAALQEQQWPGFNCVYSGFCGCQSLPSVGAAPTPGHSWQAAAGKGILNLGMLMETGVFPLLPVSSQQGARICSVGLVWELWEQRTSAPSECSTGLGRMPGAVWDSREHGKSWAVRWLLCPCEALRCPVTGWSCSLSLQWDEALLTMSKGEKAQLEIEPEWAYGKKGQPDAKYPSVSSDSLGNLGMLRATRRFMDRNITEGFTCYSQQVQDIPTQGTSWEVQLPFSFGKKLVQGELAAVYA